MTSLKEIKQSLKANKKKLRKEFAVKEIGIFGSFAKGKQKKRSDIDIVVEFEKTPDLLRFIELERYLQRLLGKKIDLVRKKTLREELKEGILKEAVFV